MDRIRSEGGIALVVAVFALVVLSGLISAGFFVGLQEQRLGRNALKLERAFTAADGGAARIVSQWNPTVYDSLPVGSSLQIAPGTLPGETGWYRGSIRRLGDRLFLVHVEGFGRDSAARQAVAVVVRLKPTAVGTRTAGVARRGWIAAN